jgi:hypothetical protein
LNACSERDGYEGVREQMAELIACARELWRTLPETETESERAELSRMTFRLVHLADILAVTTSA